MVDVKKTFCTLLLGCCLLTTSCDFIDIPQDLGADVTAQPDKALLVVYYPYSILWSEGWANILFSDAKGVRIANGTYATRTLDSGDVKVSAACCNGTNKVTLPLHVQAGNVYFVQLTPNDHSLSGVIAHLFVPSTHSKDIAESGSFRLEVVPEEKARNELRSLSSVP